MKKLILPLCCWLWMAGVTPGCAAAQGAETRVLPVLGGTLAGVAGGGYLTVSIIVLESRFGRYVHDLDDILSWRSVPIIAGAITGASLGAYSPRRLESAVLFGALGMGTGAITGWGLGSAFLEAPEGRWAGAAMGAGFGLIVGNLYGVFNPVRDPERRRQTDTGIPLVVRIPLP